MAKPGATIIVSTPNVDSFRSRKHAFFRGYHKYFGPGVDGEKDSGHMLPVDAMFVTHAARKTGLELLQITTNRQPGKSWLKELLRPAFQASLPAFVRNGNLFYGEVAIYVLRKPT